MYRAGAKYQLMTLRRPYILIYYFALIAFSSASNATPTSAKIANHRDVIPKKASIIMRSLTPSAKIIFSITILFYSYCYELYDKMLLYKNRMQLVFAYDR